MLTNLELDRLSVLVAAGRDVSGRDFVTEDLAPYLEWYWLRSAGHQLGTLLRTTLFDHLHLNLKAKAEFWCSPDLAIGFVRVRRSHTDVTNLAWTTFRLNLQRALITAGFRERWAKQIVGAIGELEDNIHTHSFAVQTGLLAYHVRDRSLECVVLDRGIGVLASLRQCEEFSFLNDHGSALKIALGDGNSRYGTTSGRGWGFHELFVGLVNSNAHLRFRSGDHLLSIEGDRPDVAAAAIRQRAHGKGLLITLHATSS